MLIFLAFLEYVHHNGLTVANISNLLAVIRALSILYDVCTKIANVCSLKINRPIVVKTNSIIKGHA